MEGREEGSMISKIRYGQYGKYLMIRRDVDDPGSCLHVWYEDGKLCSVGFGFWSHLRSGHIPYVDWDKEIERKFV